MGGRHGALIQRLARLEREADELDLLDDSPEWAEAMAVLHDHHAAIRELLSHGTMARFSSGCRCLVCQRPVPHGPNGYRNWGCRCDVCRAAGYEIHRRRNPDAPVRRRPPCGTVGGYNAHTYHGEATCEACRDAMAAYVRERRTRDGHVPTPRTKPTCGTQAGYQRHRRLGEASCDACRAASAADSRERYRKRRASAD